MWGGILVSDNLKLYNAVKTVPVEAQKKITGGRLSGMTDINPMWRIKCLTGQFGACGFGWKYEIVDKIFKEGANGEIAAFVDINLFVKLDGEWSAAIPGTGGSSFVAKESKGMYVSDECFKMALTDAISVACKSLGMAADIYFEKDRTKYDSKVNSDEKPKTESNQNLISDAQAKRLFGLAKGDTVIVKGVIEAHGYKATKEIKKSDYEKICKEISVC